MALAPDAKTATRLPGDGHLQVLHQRDPAPKLGVPLREVAPGAFREPFRDGGGGGEGVDLAGAAFLDFHDVLSLVALRYV